MTKTHARKQRRNEKKFRKGFGLVFNSDGTKGWIGPRQVRANEIIEERRIHAWRTSDQRQQEVEQMREKARKFLGTVTAEDEERFRSLLCYHKDLGSGLLTLRGTRLTPRDLIPRFWYDEMHTYAYITVDQWKAVLWWLLSHDPDLDPYTDDVDDGDFPRINFLDSGAGMAQPM